MRFVIALAAGLATIVGGSPATVALEIGDRAPDFTLSSSTGEKISLAEFRGKKAVLLEFYGGDFVPQ
jgi:peroxiredoxin